VRTQFSVVDKINEEKWRATAREAAEQCERMDLPEIRPMVTLPQLLGNWPQDVPLLHADESGAGVPFFSSPLEGEPQSALRDAVGGDVPTPPTEPAALRLQVPAPPQGGSKKAWGILVGPEGGFSGEERALIARVKAARGVSLGPRILRVDTAVITLCALSAARWGDWDRPPHFEATS